MKIDKHTVMLDSDTRDASFDLVTHILPGETVDTALSRLHKVAADRNLRGEVVLVGFRDIRHTDGLPVLFWRDYGWWKYAPGRQFAVSLACSDNE